MTPLVCAPLKAGNGRYRGETCAMRNRPRSLCGKTAHYALQPAGLQKHSFAMDLNENEWFLQGFKHHDLRLAIHSTN